jgi:protein-disulfide isomerase
MTQSSAINGVIPPPNECDHIQGSLTAAIALMEYGDYQCSRCGQAHLTVKAIQQQLGEQLCFVFRHFPQSHHFQAQRAAESAEAAAAQGKFWEMHDILFEHQQAIEDADIVEYATQLGLDLSQFLRELTEHIHAQRVQQDVDSGCSYGVTGTPTFFINIRQEGTQNLEALLISVLQAKGEGR